MVFACANVCATLLNIWSLFSNSNVKYLMHLFKYDRLMGAAHFKFTFYTGLK